MKPITTIDFKKDPIYKARTEPSIIDIPPLQFVMVDGSGGPESSDGASTEFQEAMSILFGILYTIKFWGKKFELPPGYAAFTMAPVEALWWMKDNTPFDMNRPADWAWTAMLRVPGFVTPEFFAEVVEAVSIQKKSDIYKQARLETYHEGQCVQVMHIGPYSAEPPTIAAMHSFVHDNGFVLTGKHHELYFGDPRRTAPEKLRTILRQPVRRAT